VQIGIYQRFGTTCRVPSSMVKQNLTHTLSRNVDNYQSTLRNIAEEWWFKLFFISLFVYYNQQTHICIIPVCITTVSLCSLHCYMFRHFPVTIRQFTTIALLSHTRASNCSSWKQFIKLRCFTSSLFKFSDCSCWYHNFIEVQGY
jgi:hypothetical protein